MFALTGFHNWFKTSIHKWLQIVHERSTDRIRKAVEMDQVSKDKAFQCYSMYYTYQYDAWPTNKFVNGNVRKNRFNGLGPWGAQ